MSSPDALELTSDQIAAFERDGFVALPGRFSTGEVAAINEVLPALMAEDRPENIREKASGVVRTAMGLHLRHERFADSSPTLDCSCPHDSSSVPRRSTPSR